MELGLVLTINGPLRIDIGAVANLIAGKVYRKRA
jgi:hypothetical protein